MLVGTDMDSFSLRYFLKSYHNLPKERPRCFQDGDLYD